MEACAIPDNDMLVVGILRFDLLEEGLRPFHAYARGLHKDGFTLDWVNRPVAITPFVFALPKFVRA